jgi:predicted Zn finger-like uncharacterized protein
MSAGIVDCPECKRTLRVPSDLIGKLVKCPTCGHTFTGASVEPEALPPPSSAEEPPERASPVNDPDDYDEERARQRRQRAHKKEEEAEDERQRRRSRSRSRSRWEDDDDDDDERRPRGRRRRGMVPHRGSAILTIGILSFFVFPFVLGPLAWIMGNSDLADMRAGRMDPEGEGPTNAGRTCGMIATILGVIAIVVFLLFFTCFVAGLASAPPSRY